MTDGGSEAPAASGSLDTPAGVPPTRRAGIASFLKRPEPQLALLLAEIAVLSALWTSFDWQRYLTLHLGVFDFGLSLRDIWQTTTGPVISEHMISNLFVIPYLLIPSEPSFLLFLLAFQNVIVFAGAIPVYLIARAKLESGGAGLAFATAYLFYPALTGMLWYPFHFEAFFPTFFLFGYWLYRTDRLGAAVPVFVVAILTNIGSPIVVAALGTGIIVESLVAGRIRVLAPWSRRVTLSTRRLAFATFLIVSSAVVLAIVVWGQGLTSSSSLIERSVSASNGAISITFDASGDMSAKLLVLAIVFLPLLGLPVLAREERWPLLAYWAPALLTSDSVFLDPFHDQYGSLFVPVIFVASIRALERFRGPAAADPTLTSPLAPVGRIVRRVPARYRRAVRASVPGVVLALVAISFLLLSPISPYNAAYEKEAPLGTLTLYYDPGAFTSGNRTDDAAVLDLVGVVPPGGAALVQDNLPELFERWGASVPACYVPGQAVEYVVTDPYDPTFVNPQQYPPSCTEPTTMVEWANHFLSAGYGILGEADGAVALAANDTAPPRLYLPASERFDVGSFTSAFGPGGDTWHQPGSGTFITGPTASPWGGPPVLFPGRYSVNLSLEVDHPSPTDRADWSLASPGGGPTFNVTFDGAPWTGTDGPVSVALSLMVPEYVVDPVFTLSIENWTGPLVFGGVSLTQSGLPGP